MKLSIVFTLAFMQVAFAHFELLYPPTRGFNEDTESTTPCGGANTVGNRTQMPLSNAFVQIYSSHPVYEYGIYIVAKNNPSAADFNTNLTTIGSGGRNYPEAACLPLNLNLDPGITAGTNATIQVQYNGGDGILYQCTDVTFTDSPSDWNASACVNASSNNNATNAMSVATHPFSISSMLMVFLVASISWVIV